jgi:hypothetical protein
LIVVGNEPKCVCMCQCEHLAQMRFTYSVDGHIHES